MPDVDTEPIDVGVPACQLNGPLSTVWERLAARRSVWFAITFSVSGSVLQRT